MAALAEPYPTTRVRGRRADSEQKLTITPSLFFAITSTNAIVGNTVPKRFKSTTFLKASTSKSRIVLSGAIVAPDIFPPAAFNKISIVLKRSRMAILFSSNTSLFRTSVTKNIASVFIFSSVSSSLPISSIRSRITILAPCSAK